MNEYDVVIHMNEPRYWALLLGSFACGLALIRRFQSLEGNVLERALKQMGWVLIGLQIAYQIYMVVDHGSIGPCTAACLFTFAASTYCGAQLLRRNHGCLSTQHSWAPSVVFTPSSRRS